MKLIRARIDGFRLLDDLEINFSTDNLKNITVIRAANESGKTTLLTALQWGLIGDGALPVGYKLKPMDHPDSEVIETKVEIEYEIENRNGRQRYLITRSVEIVGNDRARPKSNLSLFHVKDSGFDPEKSPYNHIQQHFPAELREVFFTDGDRALSFIEGPRAEQQHKVRAAIEKMMGLSLLESTIDHIRGNERKLRSRFDKEAGNSETRKVEEDIEDIDKKIPVLTNNLNEIQDKMANLSDKYQKADRELQEALKLGNREELAKELRDTQAQRKRIDDQRKKTETRQSALLSSSVLAKQMMLEPFAKAGKILDELRKKGQIPNKTVPILEDRLAHSDCICGESLDVNTNDGKRRRNYILELIEESREADSIKAKVSDLYFQGLPLFSEKNESWIELYTAAFAERQNIQSVYEEIGQREAELDTKLNNIPETNVQRLREIRETYSKNLRQLTIDGTRLDDDIKRKRVEKTALEKKFRSLSARVEKGEKITRELSVATDMRDIVERALDRMKTLEVKQVSDTMNALFLEMIGADEESALITRTEITPEFRIVVFGRNNTTLDPSMDLNGASRRALTISFVLALTKISGVEAPNVIDTPLGMMSGFVKTEVVRIAADNSAQLILLLTHDEIKGCENILDERADFGATITNPAHYPKILKNDPGTKEAKVLSCDCDHRSSCALCDRYENSADADRKAVSHG
jgi:DNA sulfur modification protein DndD